MLCKVVVCGSGFFEIFSQFDVFDTAAMRSVRNGMQNNEDFCADMLRP